MTLFVLGSYFSQFCLKFCKTSNKLNELNIMSAAVSYSEYYGRETNSKNLHISCDLEWNCIRFDLVALHDWDFIYLH